MTKSIIYILGAASLLSLGACKSKNAVVRADDYDSETIVDFANEHGSQLDTVQHLGVHPRKDARKPFVQTPINGRWTIISAGGNVIRQDDDMPYLIFSDAEKRFYGSNGCNIVNGDYSYAENGDLTFSNAVSTRMACPDIDYQEAINFVIQGDKPVGTKVEKEGNESYLYIYSMQSKLLMKLRRHNLDVLNGQWIVQKIGDEKMAGEDMSIFFDVPQLSTHGNTGCNYFNGGIEVDPFTPSSISFTQMAVTMRACHNEENERKMLVALEEVTKYDLASPDHLKLCDNAGKCLMELSRDTSIK